MVTAWFDILLLYCITGLISAESVQCIYGAPVCQCCVGVYHGFSETKHVGFTLSETYGELTQASVCAAARTGTSSSPRRRRNPGSARADFVRILSIRRMA